MMAAAEARAAWQRTANRYFMQEDAKRAPKWASCSNATSKLQSDAFLCDVAYGSDHHVSTILPGNANSSNASISRDTKWWLQGQTYFATHFLSEQISETSDNLFDHKMEAFPENSTYDSVSCQTETDQNQDAASDTFRPGSADTNNENLHQTKLDDTLNQTKVDDIEGKSMQGYLADDFDCKNHCYHENLKKDQKMDTTKLEESSIWEGYQKYSHDTVSSKVCENDGLWWRNADETELATLVAKKSLEHVENCDLPPPQVTYTHTSPYLGIQRSISRGCSESPSVCYQDCFGSNGKHGSRVSKLGPFPRSLDEVLSSPREARHPWISDSGTTSSFENSSKAWTESRTSTECDGNKARLLEALCHSQTRAREAEKAAAKAVSEKEWLLQLFLKEASHLFAYRQWLRILQIETFCLQIKLNEQPMSWEHLCALVPWRSVKAQPKAASNSRSSKRYKSGKKIIDVNSWSLAVALGIGLAGAGLFIGWSIGWLLWML